MVKKGRNQDQQGESSSTILRHFSNPTSENTEEKEKNESEQRKDNKSIHIDSDSSSGGTEDTLMLSDCANFQESPPNLLDVWEEEKNPEN